MRGEEAKRMESLEEAFIDVTELSNQELDTHIAMLRDIAHRLSVGAVEAAGGNSYGIDAVIPLIHIAVAEKNSRASSRLAKVAIAIALAGVFIAAAGVWR